MTDREMAITALKKNGKQVTEDSIKIWLQNYHSGKKSYKAKKKPISALSRLNELQFASKSNQDKFNSLFKEAFEFYLNQMLNEEFSDHFKKPKEISGSNSDAGIDFIKAFNNTPRDKVIFSGNIVKLGDKKYLFKSSFFLKRVQQLYDAKKKIPQPDSKVAQQWAASVKCVNK